MIEISKEDLEAVSGGRNFFSVIEGALFGGVVEGVIGFCIGGPPGMVAGFCHGLYEGAAFGVIYEGAYGLAELHESR